MKEQLFIFITKLSWFWIGYCYGFNKWIVTALIVWIFIIVFHLSTKYWTRK